MSKNGTMDKNAVIGVCVFTIVILMITLIIVGNKKEDLETTDALVLREAYYRGLIEPLPYESKVMELDKIIEEESTLIEKRHSLLKEMTVIPIHTHE